jgi:hypothetical protein
MSRTRRRKVSKFGRLSSRITREYERKGYSRKRAKHIGRATAGRIARRKRRRR